MTKKKKIFKKKPKMGRIPVAPPGKIHKDKSKYTRKHKHKQIEKEGEIT